MTSNFELKIETTSTGGLAATMMIDGKPFGEDCVDLEQLRKSAIVSGAYDIQTCGCGEPACAGFWEPIFVQHEGDLIRWEFDGRYHPIPRKEEEEEDDAKLTVVRYEFNRMQYIKEVQAKFDWLRKHPSRGSLGPHGFNPDILDEGFPDPSLPQLPFPEGATIVVGYTKMGMGRRLRRYLPSTIAPDRCHVGDVWLLVVDVGQPAFRSRPVHLPEGFGSFCPKQ